jgi:Ca2+-binding RTX toxin-like protein
MAYYNGGASNDFYVGMEQQDFIYGNAGDDWLFGGSNNDYVYGGSGGDYVHGGQGVDHVDGGSGNDTVAGGPGGDWVYSGSGYDHFAIYYGDSGTTWATADSLMDYNRYTDYIEMSIAGTSSNYVEYTIGYNAGFDQAAGTAMFAFGSGYFWGNPNTNHCFITDGVNGYLFSDLNDDNVMDTGVEIRGLTSLDQFNWSDIV